MLIGELAEASGATTKTLRFYEEAGLLPAPERTAAGYRDYNAQILPRLDFIRRGRAAGLSLTQIREVLEVRDAGSPPCQHVQTSSADA
jgi:MerR family transcriptional regulator, Zn(II)-responsive regulator of zntA